MTGGTGLNSYQLTQALTDMPVTGPYFSGVYPLNHLKNIITRPQLMIVNTDPDYQPGTHWLLFFFLQDGSVEMFDSLGKDISFYHEDLLHFVQKYSHDIYMTHHRVQPPGTALCGHYCLYYAYCCCQGERMNSILQHMPSVSFIEHCIPILFDVSDIISDCQVCCTL